MICSLPYRQLYKGSSSTTRLLIASPILARCLQSYTCRRSVLFLLLSLWEWTLRDLRVNMRELLVAAADISCWQSESGCAAQRSFCAPGTTTGSCPFCLLMTCRAFDWRGGWWAADIRPPMFSSRHLPNITWHLLLWLIYEARLESGFQISSIHLLMVIWNWLSKSKFLHAGKAGAGGGAGNSIGKCKYQKESISGRRSTSCPMQEKKTVS